MSVVIQVTSNVAFCNESVYEGRKRKFPGPILNLDICSYIHHMRYFYFCTRIGDLRHLNPIPELYEIYCLLCNNNRMNRMQQKSHHINYNYVSLPKTCYYSVCKSSQKNKLSYCTLQKTYILTSWFQ